MSELNSQQSIDNGIPEVRFSVEVFNTAQAPVDPTLSITGMAADAKATREAIDSAKDELQENIDAAEDEISAIFGNLFPVGSIFVSTSDTAPTFGGNLWRWQEIKVPATWGDVEKGYRSYLAMTSSDTPGNVHFWLRIADAEG